MTHDHIGTSLAAERATARVYEVLPDLEKLQIDAENRRDDIARFTRRLASARTPEAICESRDALTQARQELAVAEIEIARCELRERLSQPDAVAARRRAA